MSVDSNDSTSTSEGQDDFDLAEGFPELSDFGNAERFVGRWGSKSRYVHELKEWFHYDGRRWTIDHNATFARRRAKYTIRHIADESNYCDEAQVKRYEKFALECENRSSVSALLWLAETEVGVPLSPDDMDKDQFLFNCMNGTLDLKTGVLRKHDPNDMITCLCPIEYNPDAECPLVDSTLELFLPDQEVAEYLMRFLGYCLTGSTCEAVMPIAWGTGNNGKTTLMNVMLGVLGPDYSMQATPDMLMVRKNEPHSTERMDLRGKRFVSVAETDKGKRLNEALVKQLTGSDQIRARFMHKDNVQFTPTHKFLMSTNHRPVVRGIDLGIWRRLKLLEFGVSVSGDRDDKDMPTKLKAEYKGFLAKLVRGCMLWQAKGLAEPEAVTKATGSYRADQDVFGLYLSECVKSISGARTRCGGLYANYRAWCAKSGIVECMNLTNFGTELQARGYRKLDTNPLTGKRLNGVWYLDVVLIEEESEVIGN